MSAGKSSNRARRSGADGSAPVGADAGRVLGTAGHIDHGKTALVQALTGVDTDRLPEEQRRGITLELGFAPLDLPDGLHLSVVDVPGHEGLVRTMVAGATGIDLVLLVVAADEGVMPQTREHLAICGVLGLDHGVVALTRCDLAPDDVADLARDEVEALLADSALAGAPIVNVSARTGEGIDALRAALADVARKTSPHTPRGAAPRLWVDRVFAMRGFGSIVTGTLVGASLAVGDSVTLQPGSGRARVRGLQHFGADCDHAEPGARCAVNLQGIEREALQRGQLLSIPGAIEPTALLDVSVQWLPDAAPLADAMAVELLVGTAERRARIAPIGSEPIAPGAAGFARIHVESEPLPLLPGDRFVVRGFARREQGGATLGGGQVLDVAPPHRRRSDPALERDLERLAAGDPADGLALRIDRCGYAGVEQDALARQTGLAPADLEAELAGLLAAGRVIALAPAVWLSTTAADGLVRQLVNALDDFHRREPLQSGMPRAALRGALPENAPAPTCDTLLARLAARGEIVEDEDRVRRADHAPILSQHQEVLAAHLRADAMASGLEPPTPRDWQQELGVDESDLAGLLAYLVREGCLVRAPGDLFFDRGAVDELRDRVVAHLREHGRLETTEYKGLIGTSRKYAVPLMELFDAEKLTLRDGEARKLRRSRSGDGVD